MEDYVVLGARTTPPPTNPVEDALKGVKHGLSLKQLRTVTGFKNKAIKYYIYNSKLWESEGNHHLPAAAYMLFFPGY